MPQSLAHLAVHTIFSTKNRQRVFRTQAMRSATAAYATGILKGQNCPVIRIGVVVDHVHVLHFLTRTRTIADVVGCLKRGTSEWIKRQPWARGNIDFKDFAWQKGYGAFSVSPSRKAPVCAYIDGQQEHHHRVTFKDEYRRFLVEHKVEFDERYVWD